VIAEGAKADLHQGAQGASARRGDGARAHDDSDADVVVAPPSLVANQPVAENEVAAGDS
jgi:hypothetical protein